jgi:ABC-type transport system involved in multi-copper enzyme maturation permease subunit
VTGALTWARLSFAQQRWEVLILTFGVVVAIGLMLWMTLQLLGISAANLECDFFLNDDQVALPANCDQASQAFYGMYSNAEIFLRNGWLFGFGIGLIVGVPLVARDVEQGTAQMAWTLGRSRTRWLMQRVAFGVLVTVVLLAGLAVMTDLLGAAMQPNDDLGRSFHFEGNRGMIIVARGILGLGIGVLVGAMLGRQLPALLLGLIVTGLLYAAVTFAVGRWNETEAIEAWYDQDLGAPLFVGSGVRLASGERLSMGEFYGDGNEAFQGPDGQLYANAADAEGERNPIGQEYILVIPGERYSEIMARGSLVTVGAGALLMVGAAMVTSRRRPT